MSFPLGRIGYYWSDKKSLKCNASVFKDVCRSHGFELVKIDLERPLQDQGPFVAIVHKLLAFMIQADNGDLKSKAMLETFQKYVEDHPNMVNIDPLPKIRKLTDRYTQYKCVVKNLSKKGNFFIPAFVELFSSDVHENISKLTAAGIDFPILCKPTLATGVLSHQMCIVFNEEGLNDIIPPCVAQKFINHNAVLYKLFTIGDKYFMIERPSIKNLYSTQDQKTIYFNSHDVSKTDSTSILNELDDNEHTTPFIYPEIEKTDYIVEVMYKSLGLNLLGIDFIIDNKTGHYGVIDVNYFPGYSEIDDFFSFLCDLLINKIALKAAGRSEMQFNVHLDRCVTSPRGNHQKFSFDSIDILAHSMTTINSIPRCLCCVTSSICKNKVHTEPKKSKAAQKRSESLLDSHFHSLDCLQDDSGIETSDSCDEKKEPCHRTMRRLYSRTAYSAI